MILINQRDIFLQTIHRRVLSPGYSTHSAFGRGDGLRIIISGVSGRFPKAGNVKILNEKLLAGEELTSETAHRWKDNMLPKRFGFVDKISKFDAGFFGIPPRLANDMDPQTRMLLEVAFEAIIDSGINSNSRELTLPPNCACLKNIKSLSNRRYEPNGT